MNSNFRRDYLYALVPNIDMSTKLSRRLIKFDQIRYLKYDNRTKSYLFLSGRYKTKQEHLIIIRSSELQEARTLIKRIKCEGYEKTNGYDNTLITQDSQLVMGDIYKFFVVKDFIISNKPLELKDFTDHSFVLEKDGLNQRLNYQLLNSGKVLGLKVS